MTMTTGRRQGLALRAVLAAVILASCSRDVSVQSPSATDAPTTTTPTTVTALDLTTSTTSTSTPPSAPATTVATTLGRSAINVEPDRVQRGREIQVSGTGSCGRLMLRIDIGPEHGAPEVPIIANVETDSEGRFSTSAQVPADLEPGRSQVGAGHHRVEGREECLHRTGSEVIEVTA